MGETQADGTKMANVEGRLIFKGMREEKWLRLACMSTCYVVRLSVLCVFWSWSGYCFLVKLCVFVSEVCKSARGQAQIP